jgi:hypothetical protein
MKDFSQIVQIASVLAILLPIVIGVINFKKAGSDLRLFVIFLVIGFCTDATMFYLAQLKEPKYLVEIFTSYSLIESIFFFWTIYKNGRSKIMQQVVLALALATPFFWIGLVFAFPLAADTATRGRVFDTFYEIATAFLAGLVLLQMAEKEKSITAVPAFWILAGIFFYCFCTFFMMGFLRTYLSQRIWFLNNIINIFSYLLYSIGFWQLRQQPASTTP